MTIHAMLGVGEHGANVVVGDSLVRNVGGDIKQTRRESDPETVTFLDGALEKISRFRFDVEYEPLRNVYVRLSARLSTLGSITEREVRFCMRVGAH